MGRRKGVRAFLNARKLAKPAKCRHGISATTAGRFGYNREQDAGAVFSKLKTSQARALGEKRGLGD
jgi:hypothetical protein